MQGMNKVLYVNPNDENELVVDNGDGSGYVLVIYDPSGSYGALNFMTVFTYEKSESTQNNDDLIKRITESVNQSLGQFQIMDIRAHANLNFHLQRYEDAS